MTRRPPESTPFPYTTLFRSTSSPSSVDTAMLAELGETDDFTYAPPAESHDTFDYAEVYIKLDRDGDGIAEWLRSEEHTSELQSQSNLVCRLLLEKKNKMHERVHAGGGHVRVGVAVPVGVEQGMWRQALARPLLEGVRHRFHHGDAYVGVVVQIPL